MLYNRITKSRGDGNLTCEGTKKNWSCCLIHIEIFIGIEEFNCEYQCG